MTRQLSVMMPVYNGAKYVGAAIESILDQTFRSFELLIMDDGSTDDTPAILARFAANDPRIRIFPRRRQGQIASRNELLRLARSEIVACADADDICLPDRFERQMRAMAQDSSLWILGTAMISIDGSGRRRKPRRVTTGTDAVAAELEQGCCIGHPPA
jgi:glycosyltransferase involved in cell wall biosynthesis